MTVKKIIDLVGESPNSWEEAMENVVKEVKKGLRGTTRLGVKEFDVKLQGENIGVFRVRTEVSFKL